MDSNGFVEEHEPYKRLIAAIILQAVQDARTLPAEYNSPTLSRQIEEDAKDAIDFLFTDRLNIYCEMLEINPQVLQENLVKEQNRRCEDCRMTSHDRSRENRYRFNFRKNYDVYRPTISR